MDAKKNEVWDLSKIYRSEEDFLKDLALVDSKIIPEYTGLKGKLSTDDGLTKFFALTRETEALLSRLAEFAQMRADLDRKNVANVTDESKVELSFSKLNSASSYTDPEILALGKDKVDGFIRVHPENKDMQRQMDLLFRKKEHILSPALEKLISDFGPITGEGANLYSQLTVSDYTPKKIKLTDGKEVEVNLSNWTTLEEEAKNEEDRKNIFLSLYSWYDEHKNTYGEIYSNVVQSELSQMKARGYKSILDSHLDSNKIPESVFLNLIDVASTNAAPLHKYYEIRRKYLGLDKHRSYDRFIPLARSEKKYTFEEAQQIFFDSIKDYPEEYQEKAKDVNKAGYIDVYPKAGKRTGGYSSGGDNIHPYILLNFTGSLEDVFTLAHESGHSVHTLYSEQYQPLMNQNYTIFVAEIASTFNEHNLLDYFLKKGNLSRNDKIALLQKSIDQIVSTFYRQTLFGHYEYLVSQMAERNEPINYEVLNKTMQGLYHTYYGIDISEEVLKPMVWAYIPHLFYTPFYVYQYATSFTASMLIYKKAKESRKGFEDYLKMLSLGSSLDPIDEVKIAGVDLTKKDAFLSVTNRMEELVDTLEKVLSEKE